MDSSIVITIGSTVIIMFFGIIGLSSVDKFSKNKTENKDELH